MFRIAIMGRQVVMPGSLGVRLALASCLAVFAVFPASGFGLAACIDYQDYLHWVGGVDTPNPALDVAVSGSYAYVAEGSAGGLRVIDITSPSAPVILGGVDTPGSARDVAVSGDYAYVADDSSGLQVIDITNPTGPMIVGSVDTPGHAYGVAVAGNYAYVTDTDAGLQVVDVTNPAGPTIVGSVDMPGYAYGVAVAGSYAYVTFGRLFLGGGLQVVDVGNPTDPVPLGTVGAGLYVRGVTVSGSTAYVSNGAGSLSPGFLQVVDVTDPAAPAQQHDREQRRHDIGQEAAVPLPPLPPSGPPDCYFCCHHHAGATINCDLQRHRQPASADRFRICRSGTDAVFHRSQRDRSSSW